VSPASAIYEGRVRHRRLSPRAHSFEFPLFMAYLDLSEIDRVFSMTRWWSAGATAPVRYRRADYLGGGGLPLDEAVRGRVRGALGFEPDGPIRLLTHLRFFGCCFNPVSFYYCFEPGGDRLQAVAAEITNTPWKERHTYILDARGMDQSRGLRFRFDKEFHVSPFMPMGLRYDWFFSPPGERLAVHMNLAEPAREGAGAGKVFDATLLLRRRELTPGAMRRQVLRYPFMTARVVARIHWEALRLWLKGVPVFPHPESGDRRRHQGPPRPQTTGTDA
jgi:DUF1365 family protein